SAAKLLSEAKNPIMLAGRCTRSLEGWRGRIALAEKLNARVLTNLKMAAAFPTDHRLHVGPSANRLSAELQKFITDADVILSLDWLDLAGTLKQAYGTKPITAKIVQVSCDAHNHRGWSMDYQALPPIDAYLMCEPEAAVPMLIEAVRARTVSVPAGPEIKLPKAPADAVSLRGVSDALASATKGLEVCYTHLPIGWHGGYAPDKHPLDYLGAEGGGGVGAGPGVTVGAALALKDSGRVPIGVLGDGDFLMGNTTI